ncbi:hypothetical protein [Actinoplanes sp. TFC3]|uniref:hypothetical protein n=1 Tax=Actinoplanes sp. TFC3 TaxID=1710355 RepID=UPI0012903ABC|nr:hypothetical protein [Actinoplanes sp. TFC3]
MGLSDEGQRHQVVFDCNVYLDVARVLGEPFTWEKFLAMSARLNAVPLPHPIDGAFDSLRAIAVTMPGCFPGQGALEVWTSSHIDRMVRGKAVQSADRDPVSGECGLGWSKKSGQALVDDLIHGLADECGGTLGRTDTDGKPPLDHEDGLIYGACQTLTGIDGLARVYCVTRDREFLQFYSKGRLRKHSRVMSPATFVAYLRHASATASIRRFPRPS